uniref:Ovule protein n=1 Tax=Globodera pallida TaxID=36090 RepID=A0A183CKJ2_GLOPA
MKASRYPDEQNKDNTKHSSPWRTFTRSLSNTFLGKTDQRAWHTTAALHLLKKFHTNGIKKQREKMTNRNKKAIGRSSRSDLGGH